jgi:molybdenum cofactor synthesis domain-containing protein
MKQIKATEAAGYTISHDLTRILAGGRRDVAFKRGHVITEEDIPVLLSIGKQTLYVWEDAENLIHEDDASKMIFGRICGEHMHPTEPKESRINAIADADGVLRVDHARLLKLNLNEEMSVATLQDYTPVKKGDMLAGMRIIPISIEKPYIEKILADEDNDNIITLAPYRHAKVGVVTTGSEVYEGLVEDAFMPVLEKKLTEFDTEIIGQTLTPDDPALTTQAVLSFKEQGADIVLVTGGMSVDPDDRTPLAIKETGAEVITYGTPVLPGAMFMLAYLGNTAVMGLPGGVIFSRRTMFDIILPRVIAGIRQTREDLKSLGAGGLCRQCKDCTFPNCSFGVI